MLGITLPGTKSVCNTTVKTFARVTAVRTCWVAFQIECFGIDPSDEKITATIYRGATGGTPGSPLTAYKDDTAMGEAASTLATVADVFSLETSYNISAITYSLPIAIHPQYNRTTKWVRLNKDETLDLRLVGDTGLTNTNVQVTTFVQG